MINYSKDLVTFARCSTLLNHDPRCLLGCLIKYKVKLLNKLIYNNNLNWFHLPIIDLKAPDHKFSDKWQITKALLKKDLIDGKNIVIHCMGGKGRSGTIAAILLIEFGNTNKEVIKIVREKRKGAIETKEQEDFILSYRTHN